jgi:hypothetical protein
MPKTTLINTEMPPLLRALASRSRHRRAAERLKGEYQLPPSRYPVNLANRPNLKEIQTLTDALLRRVSVVSVTLRRKFPAEPGKLT